MIIHISLKLPKIKFGKTQIATIIGGLLVTLVIFVVSSMIRFDFAAGTHRVTPTAIDQNIWGHYVMYYRTTDITHNRDEDYYYILKEDTCLAEMVRGAILRNETIIVSYERYVGFKGITAPKTAPISKIEFPH